MPKYETAFIGACPHCATVTRFTLTKYKKTTADYQVGSMPGTRELIKDQLNRPVEFTHVGKPQPAEPPACLTEPHLVDVQEDVDMRVAFLADHVNGIAHETLKLHQKMRLVLAQLPKLDEFKDVDERLQGHHDRIGSLSERIAFIQGLYVTENGLQAVVDAQKERNKQFRKVINSLIDAVDELSDGDLPYEQKLKE